MLYQKPKKEKQMVSLKQKQILLDIIKIFKKFEYLIFCKNDKLKNLETTFHTVLMILWVKVSQKKKFKKIDSNIVITRYILLILF